MHASLWEGFGGGQADILVVWGVCVRHRIVGPGHCRHIGSCVVPKIGLERGVLKWAPFLCEGHVFSRSRRWSAFEGLGKGENKKKRGATYLCHDCAASSHTGRGIVVVVTLFCPLNETGGTKRIRGGRTVAALPLAPHR